MRKYRELWVAGLALDVDFAILGLYEWMVCAPLEM